VEEMVAAAAVEATVVEEEEEEEEEEDEMAMEEVVAMQDLKCERYVGQGNMTRLTVMIFRHFSFLFPSHDRGKPDSYLPSLYGRVELHNIVYSPTSASPLPTYL
jgi:hypothetical protein